MAKPGDKEGKNFTHVEHLEENDVFKGIEEIIVRIEQGQFFPSASVCLITVDDEGKANGLVLFPRKSIVSEHAESAESTDTKIHRVAFGGGVSHDDLDVLEGGPFPTAAQREFAEELSIRMKLGLNRVEFQESYTYTLPELKQPLDRSRVSEFVGLLEEVACRPNFSLLMSPEQEQWRQKFFRLVGMWFEAMQLDNPQQTIDILLALLLMAYQSYNSQAEEIDKKKQFTKQVEDYLQGQSLEITVDVFKVVAHKLNDLLHPKRDDLDSSGIGSREILAIREKLEEYLLYFKLTGIPIEFDIIAEEVSANGENAKLMPKRIDQNQAIGSGMLALWWRLNQELEREFNSSMKFDSFYGRHFVRIPRYIHAPAAPASGQKDPENLSAMLDELFVANVPADKIPTKKENLILSFPADLADRINRIRNNNKSDQLYSLLDSWKDIGPSEKFYIYKRTLLDLLTFLAENNAGFSPADRLILALGILFPNELNIEAYNVVQFSDRVILGLSTSMPSVKGIFFIRLSNQVVEAPDTPTGETTNTALTISYLSDFPRSSDFLHLEGYLDERQLDIIYFFEHLMFLTKMFKFFQDSPPEFEELLLLAHDFYKSVEERWKQLYESGGLRKRFFPFKGGDLWLQYAEQMDEWLLQHEVFVDDTPWWTNRQLSAYSVTAYFYKALKAISEIVQEKWEEEINTALDSLLELIPTGPLSRHPGKEGRILIMEGCKLQGYQPVTLEKFNNIPKILHPFTPEHLNKLLNDPNIFDTVEELQMFWLRYLAMLIQLGARLISGGIYSSNDNPKRAGLWFYTLGFALEIPANSGPILKELAKYTGHYPMFVAPLHTQEKRPNAQSRFILPTGPTRVRLRPSIHPRSNSYDSPWNLFYPNSQQLDFVVSPLGDYPLWWSESFPVLLSRVLGINSGLEQKESSYIVARPAHEKSIISCIRTYRKYIRPLKHGVLRNNRLGWWLITWLEDNFRKMCERASSRN